jgi:urea transport system substrate-binding protein
MRRRLLIGFGLAAGLAASAYAMAVAVGIVGGPEIGTLLASARSPIVVGLIHSQTGPLAISERSLIDAEILALEEIKARGGVAGRPIRWVVRDGRSDASAFASEARRLIEEDGAVVLFGCWTAECRKAVKAVVEEKGSLLLFPANFEGMEPPTRVIYAGGAVNQSVVPAVRWCFDALKSRRFFVLGTEELWSRCVAEVAKDAVKAAGAEVSGELFLPLTGVDAAPAVEAIRASGADVVLNLMVGAANPPFYAAIRRAGLTPDRLSTVAFGFAEDELRQFPAANAADAVGLYAAGNYFQSVVRPENREFVRRFQARYPDGRVTGGSIVAAYDAVMLWAQTADEVGTGDARVILDHVGRQSLDAPEGVITVDPESLAAWRPFHVGRARADGQFDLVWSLPGPIHPQTYIGTRSVARWRSFQEETQARWGGRWSSSGLPRPAGPTPE